MSSPSLEQRVAALESDAFRTHQRFDTVDGSINHLTSAVGDLSQDLRGVSLDIGEIKTVQTEHGLQLAQHGRQLDALTTSVTDIRADVTEMRTQLAALGTAVQTILERLPGRP